MTNAREALAHALAEQREKILAMVAGPELDALVAEQVFGFWLAVNPALPVWGASWWGPHSSTPGAWVHASCWFTPPLGGASYRSGDGLPKFSTDIVAAWSVVDQMREDAKGPKPYSDRQLVAMNFIEQTNLLPFWRFTAPQAATEICRAALLARLEIGP